MVGTLHLYNAEGTDSTPDWGTKMPHGEAKKKNLDLSPNLGFSWV